MLIAELREKPCRCLLFVPGSRPERFAKACSTGADQVVIDLEDAVAAEALVSARQQTLGFLAARTEGPPCGIRIHAARSPEAIADLAALAEAGVEPDFVVLPKADSAEDVAWLDAALGGRVAILPMIESPRALLAAEAIGTAAASVTALLFGGYDYALALRGRPGWETFFWPRARLACIAAAAGIDFLDVPHLGIDDAEALAAETDRVIALGATGKAAIHPLQVPVIQQRFRPDAGKVAWARRVLAACAASSGAAVQVDGAMVDRPVELAARRILGLAGLGGN